MGVKPYFMPLFQAMKKAHKPLIYKGLWTFYVLAEKERFEF